MWRRGRVRVLGVVSLGGHFETLCQDFYEVPSSIYSWSISHIFKNEFFCLGHFDSQGSKGKKVDLSFSEQHDITKNWNCVKKLPEIFFVTKQSQSFWSWRHQLGDNWDKNVRKDWSKASPEFSYFYSMIQDDPNAANKRKETRTTKI